MASCWDMMTLVIHLVGCPQNASERALREHTALVERNQRINMELQEQIAANTHLLAENGQKALQLREKEDALKAVQEEIAKTVKAKEAALAKLNSTEKVKEQLSRQTDDLRQAQSTTLVFIALHCCLHIWSPTVKSCPVQRTLLGLGDTSVHWCRGMHAAAACRGQG